MVFLRNPRVGRRPGFTLIELMVVIGIIAILMTLLAGAYFRVVEGQRESNTTTVVQKIARALEQQWKAVVDQASKEDIPAQLQAVIQQEAADNFGRNPRRERVIWIKERLRQEFPMNFAEVTTPGANTKRAYLAALQPPGQPVQVPNWDSQSAVLIYLILQEHRRGMNFDVDKELSSADVSVDSTSGLKQIVDGWGRPLVFVRWPSANEELNPNRKPQPKFNDPQDPEGLLQNPKWVGSAHPDPNWGEPDDDPAGFAAWATANPGPGQFWHLCHPVAPNASYKLLPAVVSAGKDGQWGFNLNPPDNPANPGNGGTMKITDASQAGDNIYSFFARLGSRGN